MRRPTCPASGEVVNSILDASAKAGEIRPCPFCGRAVKMRRALSQGWRLSMVPHHIDRAALARARAAVAKAGAL